MQRLVSHVWSRPYRRYTHTFMHYTSELGWGVGAGVCICGRHRAYVQHVRTRFSQAGRGTYGHCANRLDSGWRHGMLQGFDILYGYGARVQEGLHWGQRGQLHGGRPHVLWRMRATGGMESEPTKTQLYERTSILRRATRVVLGDSRTVGGACRGICAGRVDVPCRLCGLFG